jgi:hypothetical protein
MSLKCNHRRLESAPAPDWLKMPGSNSSGFSFILSPVRACQSSFCHPEQCFVIRCQVTPVQTETPSFGPTSFKLNMGKVTIHFHNVYFLF